MKKQKNRSKKLMHKADLLHDDNRLQAKLESIYQLRRTRSKINWDREQYIELLEKFGNPHLSLPPVIHVAGTNGKGSVIAIMRSILERAGLIVHCYTSPHLINVNERIYLAGRDIDNVYLEELIDQTLEYNDGAPLSFFEITTAIAFKAFSDAPADILLLEVGMGGRLDCTNVINSPLATIINRISLDHTEFLGDHVAAIAKEKAGIMKRGIPCVIGYQGSNEVIKTLENEASSYGAKAYIYGRKWGIEQKNNSMIFTFDEKDYEFPMPSLQGDHQVQNAGVALATLFSISDKINITHKAMEQGLKSVQWQGRLQKINIDDLSAEIWLDCGHNDSAGEALATQIKQWGGNIHLVMGMLEKKDASGFLKPLLPLIKSINIVPISSDADTKTKSDINVDTNIQIHEHDSFIEAVKSICSHDKSAMILIAGSVYLAGEVLKYINLGKYER